ncbi:MAG TPA: acyl-CoA dehydrogenase family protein [Actinophytocola sp.]|uniref:acyl-CoA dehydrogenase family protein n=1 Tax=Actinophytocola sp. TaxID=1872138 RepID=UPI002DBBAA30|nr:acyl-CoA dehydrogenase family protein [Actinophytocola sp.]HEU5471330.1 acyl-CoA dehydrogenase family protein [Actinophytocola sp.]
MVDLDALPAGADGRTVWRALGQAGLITELFDPGPGPRLDLLDVLLTELDRRLGVGTVLSICVQLATALPILRGALPGTDTAAKVTDAATRGETVLALAVTDAAAAGSDLMALGTTARLDGDRVTVDGGKTWITNARTADYALVLARHRPQRHFTSFLWVLVPTDAPGVLAEPAGTGLFAGSGVGHLRFDGVTLGRDHLIGSPGRGLPTFARHVGTERAAGALWARAICRRVLAGTQRRLADRGLWTNDAVRDRFARCLVELRRMDAMCAQHAAAGPDALLSSMLLKASTAQSLDLVLAECVQLLGAEAFGSGGVAELRAEAAMFGIAGGASGAMLAGIAEHATDLVGAP